MKNIKLTISVIALASFVIFISSKSNAEEELTFKLVRGIAVCANLPQQADNFECKPIGWPDQNSRIDLIKQEFVEKNGKQVRWGQFDYYYFFNGSKKCEPHKAKILAHLKERKDMNELLDGLGTDRDCIRQGRGWIQTRNVEIWTGNSKEHKALDEASGGPKHDYIIPKSDLDEKLKKMDADIEYDGKEKTNVKDGMTLQLKKARTNSNKATVIKFEDEREPQSTTKAPRPPSSERLPKEYF